MSKYKIIERKANPMNKQDKTVKYYAKPVSERALSTAQFAKNASVGMAITPKEMEAAIEQFSQYAMQMLLMGRSVEIPNIGTLRLSFKSDGAESPEKFNARTMINSPRILFRPKPDIRSTIMNSITYENAGVRAGGKDYPSIKAYTDAMGGGGSSSQGGNTGGGGNQGGGTSGSGDDNGGF